MILQTTLNFYNLIKWLNNETDQFLQVCSLIVAKDVRQWQSGNNWSLGEQELASSAITQSCCAIELQGNSAREHSNILKVCIAGQQLHKELAQNMQPQDSLSFAFYAQPPSPPPHTHPGLARTISEKCNYRSQKAMLVHFGTFLDPMGLGLELCGLGL